MCFSRQVLFFSSFIRRLLNDEVFFQEFMKITVDLADLVGLYLVMQRVSGKGQVKVLVAGLGWAFAELVFTRVIVLWVGARGIEFDWKYIQKSFDANISLVRNFPSSNE